MRLLAVLMLPFAPWVALILTQFAQVPVTSSREWLLMPGHAFPLLGFLLIGALHGSLGLRTITDDYVHHALAKRVCVLAAIGIPAGIFVIGLATLLRIFEGMN